MHTSIEQSVESHVVAFAAEEARLRGTVVELDAFRKAHQDAPRG